jgi:hypothetical protein
MSVLADTPHLRAACGEVRPGPRNPPLCRRLFLRVSDGRFPA